MLMTFLVHLVAVFECPISIFVLSHSLLLSPNTSASTLLISTEVMIEKKEKSQLKCKQFL